MLSSFFIDPSFEAISAIKSAGEVVVDGLFTSQQYENSELRLVLLIGKYLIQY